MCACYILWVKLSWAKWEWLNLAGKVNVTKKKWWESESQRFTKEGKKDGQRERKNETNSGEVQRSHLVIVSDGPTGGLTHTQTHAALHKCPLQNILTRTHTSHSATSQCINPRNQHTFNPNSNNSKNALTVTHSASGPVCSKRLHEDFSVQQEFRERSGWSLCIFKETLKPTSELAVTHAKCQDKKRIFQALNASGFPDWCLKACSYMKDLVIKFTELKWKKTLSPLHAVDRFYPHNCSLNCKNHPIVWLYHVL